MELKELKNLIEFGAITEVKYIFKYSDNKFLCSQYTAAIISKLNANAIYVNDLSEIPESNELFNQNKEIYLLDVDDLKSDIPSGISDFIITCKKYSASTKGVVIEIPQLQEWQLEDYVKGRVQGLSSDEVKDLCKRTKYDPYRLKQECDKLALFTKSNQPKLLKEIILEGNFKDGLDLNIFGLINSIIKQDKDAIKEVVKNLSFIDIEGTGIVTLLTRNIKKFIFMLANPGITPGELGVQPKQFAAIKYNANKYSIEQLLQIYEFLTSIDMKLKKGELQFKAGNRENNESLVEYLIAKTMIMQRSY